MLCLVAVTGSASAQTLVTLQQGLAGYVGAADTKIRSSNPTTNYGDSLDIEVDGSPDYGGLLRWDVSGIPVGSVVTSVELTINVFNPSPHNYEIYESRRAWTENGATWQVYDTGLPWQAAGASGANDRDTLVLGAFAAPSTGFRTAVLNAAGISVVRNWVDNPSSNLGFMVQDYTDATDGIDFDTKEVATLANRPALAVTYFPAGTKLAPVAAFVADPPGGNVSLSVAFDASSSSDADGTISSYSWDFGDGDVSTGVSASHVYLTAGVFTARLIVTDDDAKSDTTTRAIRVTGRGPVTFAILGDFGDAGTPEADVAAEVLSWNPDFIITAGDNNYPDGAAATVDANIGQYFGDFIYPYAGIYGSTSVVNRFFPTLGNHDWRSITCAGAICTGPHFDYFDLPAIPADERYYDFVWGDVHFFAIDSDTHEPDGTGSTSTQAQWLQSRLVASTATWKIVFFHHAAYSSSSSHGSTVRMQWPFAEWGADAVIGGHDHTYERIFQDGIVYFVNGLGGRSLYGLGAPIEGSVVRYNGDYGAMRVVADSIQITFEFITRTGAVIDTYSLSNTPFLSIKAFLEGPYDTFSDSMVATDVNPFVPLAQPFDTTIFDGTPLAYSGTETVSSMPADAVGWVLAQLRTGNPAAPPMITVSSRAGLLRSDGTVADTSGASVLAFPGVANGDYSLALFHRNHLGVVSAAPITLAGRDTATIDFTASSDAAFGSNPMKELEPTIWGLYAGDATSDGQVLADDFNEWLVKTKAVAGGFEMSDFDLDGMVTVSDFNLWLVNTKAVAESRVP